MWRRSRDAFFSKKATLPDGVRIYAIGDIHGRTDLLTIQLAQIDADMSRHRCARSIIVFLGDYIDRGPDSRGTISLLLTCARLHEVVFLKGNHEIFVRRFIEAPGSLKEWRCLGGLETLLSYGLKPSLNRNQDDDERLAQELVAALPPEHLSFFDSLPMSFSCGDFFFVHAGVRPGIGLHQQTEDDLLWIREDFLDHRSPFDKFIVHGHTPVNIPDIRPNRANIDTGAFATGRLSCLMIERSDIIPLVDIRLWDPSGQTRVREVSSMSEDIEAMSSKGGCQHAPQAAVAPGR